MGGLAPVIIAAIGTTVASVASRPQTPGLPQLPPLPETPSRGTSPEVTEAADEQRRTRSRARGRSSTILGGEVGSPLQPKTLLGE